MRPIALFAVLMSMHNLIPLPLGTITKGLIHGVASLVTSSIMPAACSCSSLLFECSYTCCLG